MVNSISLTLIYGRGVRYLSDLEKLDSTDELRDKIYALFKKNFKKRMNQCPPHICFLTMYIICIFAFSSFIVLLGLKSNFGFIGLGVFVVCFVIPCFYTCYREKKEHEIFYETAVEIDAMSFGVHSLNGKYNTKSYVNSFTLTTNTERFKNYKEKLNNKPEKIPDLPPLKIAIPEKEPHKNILISVDSQKTEKSPLIPDPNDLYANKLNDNPHNQGIPFIGPSPYPNPNNQRMTYAGPNPFPNPQNQGIPFIGPSPFPNPNNQRRTYAGPNPFPNPHNQGIPFIGPSPFPYPRNPRMTYNPSNQNPNMPNMNDPFAKPINMMQPANNQQAPFMYGVDVNIGGQNAPFARNPTINNFNGGNDLYQVPTEEVKVMDGKKK